MYLDCLANGFRILSESSSDSKVDYGDFPPSVPSVWHCVELCRLYADCVWISWERSADDQEDSRKYSYQMKPIKTFVINYHCSWHLQNDASTAKNGSPRNF